MGGTWMEVVSVYVYKQISMIKMSGQPDTVQEDFIQTSHQILHFY